SCGKDFANACSQTWIEGSVLTVRQSISKALRPLFFLGLGLGVGISGSELWQNAPTVIAGKAEAAGSSVAVDAPRNHDLPKIDTPVTRVVRNASPSVVTVGAVKRTVVPQQWVDPFLVRRIGFREQVNRLP